MLSTTPRAPSELETYLCRSLALALLAYAALVLLLTGTFPLPGAAAAAGDARTSSSSNDDEDGSNDRYAYPTLLVTTVYHALTAFYLYMQVTKRGGFGFGAGLTASTGLFCFGVWMAVFGWGQSRVSGTTGADKRTSGWPFGNAESARSKKKEVREEKKEGRRRGVGRTSSGR